MEPLCARGNAQGEITLRSAKCFLVDAVLMIPTAGLIFLITVRVGGIWAAPAGR